jgi:hypothetical protein
LNTLKRLNGQAPTSVAAGGASPKKSR